MGGRVAMYRGETPELVGDKQYGDWWISTYEAINAREAIWRTATDYDCDSGGWVVLNTVTGACIARRHQRSEAVVAEGSWHSARASKLV